MRSMVLCEQCSALPILPGYQILFVQNKHTVAAAGELRPDKGQIRIRCLEMNCAVTDLDAEAATGIKVFRRLA